MVGRKDYPLRTKILSWACLTTIQIATSTILKLATHNNNYNFSPQSSLTISECIKCVLSILYLYKDHRSIHATKKAFLEQSSTRLTLHLFALAGIYCVNNGIMFYTFAHADPGSIAMVKSCGTIISALMLYHRGFRLSLLRWAVIIVQMLGLIIAQYDPCLQKVHLSSTMYLLLFMSVWNSSLANVWNEHVIKSYQCSTIATKNIYLYLFGGLFNLAGFWQIEDTRRFWDGYSGYGVLVVLSNALMGLGVNVVYKYADAVVKNLATTSTTVGLVGLSAVLFGGRGDVMVIVGCVVVVGCTYLYFGIGGLEEVVECVK